MTRATLSITNRFFYEVRVETEDKTEDGQAIFQIDLATFSGPNAFVNAANFGSQFDEFNDNNLIK